MLSFDHQGISQAVQLLSKYYYLKFDCTAFLIDVHALALQIFE